MAALPNLSGNWRAAYVLAGVALAAWGIGGAERAWAQMILVVLGGGVIVEGLIGF